ncbi:MAG: DUF1003 domain-containing protein [Verrucomicrobiota bacterium]|nr:DUF1003 domain-containing protein [Verrucomicrobiota bacterium]
MAVAPRLDLADPPVALDHSCGPIQREQLRKVPLFDTLSDEAAEKLCALLVPKNYKAPTRLFDAGDQGDAMYLIDYGRVQITVMDADGQEVTLSELHEGDFFGEMALIDGHERSAGATVLEDSRLVILRREDFLSFLAHDHQVMLAMLGAMAKRLRRTDNLLRHRVSRNANAEEAAHITAADRAADKLAEFGGSWKFIGFAIGLIVLWMVMNSFILATRPIETFPYAFLNLLLGIIAALQAPIIMMSQNRQSEKDRLRSDLDYEVNLKNELLLTEIRSLLHEQRRRESNSQPTIR